MIFFLQLAASKVLFYIMNLIINLKKNKKIISLFIIFISLSSCNLLSKKNDIKLNEIQVIGSHNSYKLKIQEELLFLISKRDSSVAKSLQYEHKTLTKQLDIGLRSLEIDVFYDPKGGHYSKPIGQQLLMSNNIKPKEFDIEKTLDKPGLKVFHVQDIDFRSHNLLFKDNLLEIKKWSDNNPKHIPLFILINPKDAHIKELTRPLEFTSEALNNIDKEIKQIFNHDDLITPDYVRGKYETLEKAILEKGWPELNQVRGKILFFLDVGKAKKNLYLENHPSLRKRIMFTNSEEGKPEAAFRLLNNPIEDFEYIKKLVKKGYIVRTRADEDTKEARSNDYERFNMAKKSGAQVISTDYYIRSKLFNSLYEISFEDRKFVRFK